MLCFVSTLALQPVFKKTLYKEALFLVPKFQELCLFTLGDGDIVLGADPIGVGIGLTASFLHNNF